MKIGFYSPYLDTLGGGERYCLTLASHWSVHHKVELFWNDASIIESAQKRLNIDLSRIKVTRNIFRGINVFRKLFLTRQYDLIFFLSDGSIPSTLARHNILHTQCPFPSAGGRRFINMIKLKKYRAVVCNSKFTKRFIDEEYGVNSRVIYPPVSVDLFKPGKKEKIILSVGRFSAYYINKKQVEMVRFFRQLQLKHKEWKLVLAGGLLEQDRSFFDCVQQEARGLSVDILPNVSFDHLVSLYKKAPIYWHAAGYGEDQERNPAGMEHFGITTVEAMSAGAVPIVFAGGGQPEIVEDGKNGFLWSSIDELLEKTNQVIMNKTAGATLQKHAIERSKQFSVSRFCDAFDGLLEGVRL